MAAAQTQILNHEQVKQIIRRMAYQVYEQHFSSGGLIIAGISGRGETIARMLHDELSAICNLRLALVSISLDKDNPVEQSVKLSGNTDVANKNVVVVDDVLNTGRTLIYALLPFIRQKTASIRTAVLVDRNHKTFPVNADYIGISLSTTLQEHIEVHIERKKVNVYLK